MMLLLFACGVSFAQDAATTEGAAGGVASGAATIGGASDAPTDLPGQAVVIVGADETALPIPEPWKESSLVIPDLVPAPPASVTVPAIQPPAEDGAELVSNEAALTGAPPP
jgi:hypothetical protein